MITCVGCLSEIHNNSGRIDCARCKQCYHNLCVNITDKNLKKMPDTQKANWQCPNCHSKQPRGDNTNTPVKQTSSSSSSAAAPSNVTTRKATKSAGESSIPQVPSSGALTSSAEIRDIINEALKVWATGICNQLNDIRSEVVSLKESMSFFNEQFEELNAEVKAQKTEVRRLSDENCSLRRDVMNLTTHCNQMDQLSRAVNLEIQCVPEHKNENITRIVQQLGKIVSCPINETDISHCTRVAKKNPKSPRPRTILVRFTSPRLRDSLLAASIKYNKCNQNDKLNSSHLGLSDESKPAIYVAENLSPENKALHAATRARARELGYQFVWVRNGRVFVRKDVSSPSIVIRDISCLNSL